MIIVKRTDSEKLQNKMHLKETKKRVSEGVEDILQQLDFLKDNTGSYAQDALKEKAKLDFILLCRAINETVDDDGRRWLWYGSSANSYDREDMRVSVRVMKGETQSSHSVSIDDIQRLLVDDTMKWVSER